MSATAAPAGPADAAAAMLEDAPVIDRENPWPGLVSFPEAAEKYFNGRDQERDDLLRLIRRETLTLLYGVSGLGKSSLLRAGLFPVLRQERFLPVYVRLDHAESSPEHDEQVRSALLGECAAWGVEAPPARAGESVWELLHRADGGFWNAKNYPVTPVLVFDQFEEIFTLGTAGPARRDRSWRFIEELGDLVDNRAPEALVRRLDADPAAAAEYAFASPGCKVVLSMREDFLAELGRLGEHTRSTFQNYLRLLRMRGDTAVNAILSTGGDLVGADVARAIVWFLAKVPAERQGATELAAVEVEPALLSLVCRELNDRRRDAGRVRIDEGLLDVSQTEILAKFYRESFAGARPGVRVFVEEELLTETGFRDAAAIDDALRLPDVTEAALDALVARRLIRKEERFGTPRVELTHDVLTDVVRDSRDRRRAEEAARKRRTEQEAALRARRRALGAGGALLAALAVAAVLWSGWRAKETGRQAARLKAYSTELAARDRIVAVQQGRAARLSDSLTTQQGILRSAVEQLALKQDSVRAMLRTTAAARRQADVSQRVAVVGAETADYYLDVTGRGLRRQVAQSDAIDETARADLAQAAALRRYADQRVARSDSLERAVASVLCGDIDKSNPRFHVRAAVDAILATRTVCAPAPQAQGPPAAVAPGPP